MTTQINIVAVISHPDAIAPQEAMDIAVESLERGVAQLAARLHRENPGGDGAFYNVDSATATLLDSPPQVL